MNLSQAAGVLTVLAALLALSFAPTGREAGPRAPAPASRAEGVR